MFFRFKLRRLSMFYNLDSATLLDKLTFLTIIIIALRCKSTFPTYSICLALWEDPFPLVKVSKHTGTRIYCETGPSISYMSFNQPASPNLKWTFPSPNTFILVPVTFPWRRGIHLDHRSDFYVPKRINASSFGITMSTPPPTHHFNL